MLDLNAGRSRFWRDRFDSAPTTGDLYPAMEGMGREVIGVPHAMKIELLGFAGCPNTPAMRENLRAALASSGGQATFVDVDQGTLAAGDIRRGWPTPTVLVDGADLYGMAPPSSPSMGCRVYAGGVPDAADIAERLGAITSSPRHRRPAE